MAGRPVLTWESVAHLWPMDGPRIARGSFTLLQKRPRLVARGAVEFVNLELWQRFSRMERVTGIEPALSAWESDMNPRSVLTGRM
jgi:hypothetical protein